MKKTEIEKSKVFNVAALLEYVPNSVAIMSILNKTTGDVSALSFDSGEELTSKTLPFDTLIEIISGKTEVVIDDKPYLLETGECIIIPAHARNTIKADGQLKMMRILIKSGYEDLI